MRRASLTEYLEEKPRGFHHPLRLLAIVLVVALLGLVILLILSLFRQATHLMQLPARPFNAMAAHLMPPYDEISFQPQGSDLQLNGWYFATEPGTAKATIILVHGAHQDRLLFDLDTADLIRFLLDQHFNVLAYDARHAGLSDGDLDSYGYAEYRDVLGAMRSVQRLSGSKNVILYGFGSGIAASLFAWEALPEALPQSQQDTASGSSAENAFNQDDVRALIVDSPASSVSDYIRLDLNPQGLLNAHFFYQLIPWAVRVSSGGSGHDNLIPLAGNFPGPMLILGNEPDSRLSAATREAFLAERQRLNPDTTSVFTVAVPGHLNAYLDDPEGYKNALGSFLDRWIASS